MKRCAVLRTAARGAVLSILVVLSGLGCVKRPVDYAREHAKTLAPAKLEAAQGAPPATGPLRRLRVRVYADSDYREQVVRWRSRIVDQLRRASDAVRAPLGVTFELETTHPWERRVAGDDLDASLNELEALDSGEDVDLVIGFISALKVFTVSQHQLGMARMMGRHIVLREMENPAEVRQLMEALIHLPQDEREALYQQRRQHKETSVLLHEWAHTLGVFHVQDSHWMMYPNYEPHQAAFAPRSVELIQVSLRHLPRARKDAAAFQAWARELKEKIAAAPWPGWEGADKDELTGLLDGALAGRLPHWLQYGVEPLPSGARQEFEELLALDKQGRSEVAAQRMEPLVRRYPDHVEVQLLACYLYTRAAPRLPSTRERCEATAKRFPRQHAPLFNLARMELSVGRHAEAQAYLVQGRQRLEAGAGVDVAWWGDLAAFFKETSSVTWAEEAAARVAGDKRAGMVLTWARQTRRWVGLPADSGVPVEREGELVRAVKEVEAQLDKGQMGKAQARVASLAKQFPRAPAVEVLRCELHLRSGATGPARTACRKAVSAYDEAVAAHFILGWLAKTAGAKQEARTHLERVVALEPAHADAQRMLKDLQ
ncbi:MAG TPA: matrixin family metalloprotease [Myxococcus sp.]|nr:matrixin family metalloprotease [Myxococcus sp.]